MKLGINTYTFMWSIGFQGANPAYPERQARPAAPLTALGLLHKARQMGVHLVQTGPNLPLEALPLPELEQFIQTAMEWGIELELGTRGLDFAHLKQQAALARRMGARLLRTLPEIGGKFVLERSAIVQELRKILPLLEGEGMRLGIENGRLPASELRAALEELDSPQVGVVLDMVNSLAVPEGWKEVTRLLAPFTMCLHYKDFTIARQWHMMGFICEGAPAGKGLLETGWLLEQLDISPHPFNMILELWTPEQATLEETIALEQAWAVESIAYLRKYVRF